MSAVPGFGSLVMPGLDPGIHQMKLVDQASFFSDGLPGQARQ
jgi:hypothetical protein